MWRKKINLEVGQRWLIQKRGILHEVVIYSLSPNKKHIRYKEENWPVSSWECVSDCQCLELLGKESPCATT
jgi:hypothetical protein